MKIAEIVNLIWSQGNPQLMDQIAKLVGMTKWANTNTINRTTKLINLFLYSIYVLLLD